MPDLTLCGYSSHIMNLLSFLLGQDLTPNEIISQIVVNKFFRNHHIPGALC